MQLHLLPLDSSSSSSSSLMINLPSDVTLKPCSILDVLFKSGLVARLKENTTKCQRSNFKSNLTSYIRRLILVKSRTQNSLCCFRIKEVERFIGHSFFQPGLRLLFDRLLLAFFWLLILGVIRVRLCQDVLNAAGTVEKDVIFSALPPSIFPINIYKHHLVLSLRTLRSYNANRKSSCTRTPK